MERACSPSAASTAFRQIARNRCEIFWSSSALATVFVPRLGYEMTTALVKQSLKEKRPFSALVIERGLLTESDVLASLYLSAGKPVPGA